MHQIKQPFKIKSSIILTGIVLILIIGCKVDDHDSEASEITSEINDPLRHLVMFKFKEDADSVKIKAVESAFAALPSKIPEIKSFEWGLNNSPEGLDKGFTHCFVITFASEEDRAIYLPHEDHQAFVALLDDLLEDVFVLDYWAK